MQCIRGNLVMKQRENNPGRGNRRLASVYYKINDVWWGYCRVPAFQSVYDMQDQVIDRVSNYRILSDPHILKRGT